MPGVKGLGFRVLGFRVQSLPCSAHTTTRDVLCGVRPGSRSLPTHPPSSQPWAGLGFTYPPAPLARGVYFDTSLHAADIFQYLLVRQLCNWPSDHLACSRWQHAQRRLVMDLTDFYTIDYVF